MKGEYSENKTMGLMREINDSSNYRSAQYVKEKNKQFRFAHTSVQDSGKARVKQLH